MVMGRTAQISNAMCAMKERLYSRSGGLIKTLLKIAAAHTLTVGLYHRLFGMVKRKLRASGRVHVQA